MNFLCKLGLAVLAGAAVILGINKAEKCSVTTNANGENNTSSENSVDSTIPSSEQIPQESNKKSGGFMKKVKKAQTIIEVVSRVVGCVYRICDCISEMFGKRNNNYSNGHYYCNNNGSTTIIL